MNKKTLTILSLVGVIAAGATFAFKGFNPLLNLVIANENTTTITVDTAVTTSETYTQTTYTHQANEHFKLQFDHVKVGGGVGTILKGSYVRRVEETRNIKSIKVNFSPVGGSVKELKVQSWYVDGDLHRFTHDLTSGVAQSLRGNYFCLIAGASNDVKIDSIEVTFGCQTFADRPAAATITDKYALTNYATLDEVFTWDDTTNDISWYIIQCELKNNKDWDTVFPNNCGNRAVKLGDSNWNTLIQVDEVRLLSSGRMQFFCNIFGRTTYSDKTKPSGDFYAHFSYQNISWDNNNGKGDVIPSTTWKYNGDYVSDATRKNNMGSGGCSKGTYTCWSQYNMCNLTINWK